MSVTHRLPRWRIVALLVIALIGTMVVSAPPAKAAPPGPLDTTIQADLTRPLHTEVYWEVWLEVPDLLTYGLPGSSFPLTVTWANGATEIAAIDSHSEYSGGILKLEFNQYLDSCITKVTTKVWAGFTGGFYLWGGPRTCTANPPQQVTVDNLNWAGYGIAYDMSTPGDTEIVAELTVPAIHCARGKTSGMAWVGFGGTANTSLPQIGLEFDCKGSKPDYSIWYEWYDPAVGNTSLEPDSWKKMSRQSPLQAGDHLLLEMQYVARSRQWSALWEAAYDDTGLMPKWDVRQTFGRVPRSTTRTGDSAECIVEVPTGVGNKKLTLTNFDPVQFQHCVTIGATASVRDDISGAKQTTANGRVSNLLGTRYVMRATESPDSTVLARPQLTGETFHGDASFVVKYKP